MSSPEFGSPGAMRRRWRRTCVTLILLGAAGCGGAATAPSTDTATVHAEVSDARGDALPDPSVPVSPDLGHGTIDVSAGNITLTIQFAPGTFDRATTRIAIRLDTDRNPSTGISTADGLGIEYVVDMWAATNQATILKAVPTAACTATDPCYLPMGAAPLTLLTDTMAVTVPLSLVESADGRLSYRVLAYASTPGGAAQTIIADVMPDTAALPGHVP